MTTIESRSGILALMVARYGGTLVKFIGFEAIGYAATVLVALELLLFNMTRMLIARRAS
jgi:hypothetical protein